MNEMNLSRDSIVPIGLLSCFACTLVSGIPALGRTITIEDWKEINQIGSYGGRIKESPDLEAELKKLYLVSTDSEDLLACERSECLRERDRRYRARVTLFNERNFLATTVAKVSPADLLGNSIRSTNSLLGEMVLPLPSLARISSGFGWRHHPMTGLESFHQGTDLAAPAGTPVLASFSGTVIDAGDMGNLGNAVVLDSGSVRTRYGHMSRAIVSAGESVNKGQVIGFVGSTGRSTGPHLHFEVWHLDASGQWKPQDYTATIRSAFEQYRSTFSER